MTYGLNNADRKDSQNPMPSLVIEGGTLIDGTGRNPRTNVVVIIEGNKIRTVGEKGVTYPPGARVIPASGKFILPGLINMHVHWRDWMPELNLAHGITSVVDMSSMDWVLAQRQLLTDGRVSGPRLFTSTPTIGGRLLWDIPPNTPVETVTMARKVMKDFGPGRGKYSVTKAYTELTPDQLQVIVEESHKAGRNVMAHLGSLDARQAADLGVDALAHATGVALATITDPVKAEELRAFTKIGIAVDYPLYLVYHAFMDPAKVEELISLLVEKRVRIEPELVNIARWASQQRESWLAEDSRLLQDPNLCYIPVATRDKTLYTKPLERLSKEQRDQLCRGYENLQGFLRRFVQAGGVILAGTDEASFILPGISLHRELQLLVDAGLTPMQAIQAATKNNADFLQVSDLGTIEPGNLADLIVVREDPIADINNLRTVEVVVKDGKVMDTRYHADFSNPLPFPPRPKKFPNPVPSIRTLYPMTSKNLNKELILIIEGSNLVDESLVEFGGVAIPTSPVKGTLLRETMFHPVYTQLTAIVPAHLLSRVASYQVVVRNPPPEGGTSNILNFFVSS